MNAPLLSRVLWGAWRLLRALLVSVLICGGITALGGLFGTMQEIVSLDGGDTVLVVGQLKLVFRQEYLAVCGEKWEMLCASANTILPPLVPEAVDALLDVIAKAFFSVDG